MYAGIYNAASAMDMAERRHELTAHNLAAANIPDSADGSTSGRPVNSRPRLASTSRRGACNRRDDRSTWLWWGKGSSPCRLRTAARSTPARGTGS